MVHRNSSCLALVAALCLTGSTGCSQLNLFDRFGRPTGELTARDLKKIPVATDKTPVWEVVGLWEEAQGVGLDGLPSRGFAGRIMFFPFSSSGPDDPLVPLQIRGGVVKILVFDDRGTEEEQGKPFHQFQFDAESFQAFLTLGDMGGAYQLFIPYTRNDKYGSRCSLQVVYQPEKGRPVFSKRADVILPGAAPRKTQQAIQPAAYEQHQQANSGVTQAAGERPVITRTHTHQLPPSVSRSMTISSTTGQQITEAEKARLKSHIQELVDKTAAAKQADQ